MSLKLKSGDAEIAKINGGSLQTAPRPAPEYAYRYSSVDENLTDKAKSGDGRLEQGERARISVEVTNRGAAENPLHEVNLSADEKEELYLGRRHRTDLDDLRNLDLADLPAIHRQARRGSGALAMTWAPRFKDRQAQRDRCQSAPASESLDDLVRAQEQGLGEWSAQAPCPPLS